MQRGGMSMIWKLDKERQADSKGGKDRLTAVVDADHLVCE
jgi:hypothetical protein